MTRNRTRARASRALAVLGSTAIVAGAVAGITAPASAVVATGKGQSSLTLGTSVSIAVRSGEGWAWCQSPWGWVPENTDAATVTMPIGSFGCDTATLTDVHDVLVFFNAGTFAIDRLTLR